jgi:hypothetical protein
VHGQKLLGRIYPTVPARPSTNCLFCALAGSRPRTANETPQTANRFIRRVSHSWRTDRRPAPAGCRPHPGSQDRCTGDAAAEWPNCLTKTRLVTCITGTALCQEKTRSSPAVQTAILALQRGPAPFDRAVPTPRPGTPCWRLAEGCQGFPRRPCPRAFRCVGRIVCGSPQFSGHGLACCYASAAEAIKLGDTHVNGRSNIITASSNPSDFKKAHRFTFR